MQSGNPKINQLIKIQNQSIMNQQKKGCFTSFDGSVDEWCAERFDVATASSSFDQYLYVSMLRWRLLSCVFLQIANLTTGVVDDELLHDNDENGKKSKLSNE
jgi:hypothetical protein